MDTSPAARSTPRVRRELAGGKRPDGHRRLRLRVRPNPASIHVRPTEERLTGVAGLVPFGVFVQRLGVDRALHDAFDPLKSGVRVIYRVGDVLRLLIDGLVLGETRQSGTPDRGSPAP